jgi:hypothetical protein
MSKYLTLCVSVLFVVELAVGQETELVDEPTPAEAAVQTEGAEALQDAGETPELAATTEATSGAPKTLAGMSILGNEEAPKSLVIVPWKSSEIGDGLGVTDAIDERARPVDKEVFLREVHYYELRSGAGG